MSVVLLQDGKNVIVKTWLSFNNSKEANRIFNLIPEILRFLCPDCSVASTVDRVNLGGGNMFI